MLKIQDASLAAFADLFKLLELQIFLSLLIPSQVAIGWVEVDLGRFQRLLIDCFTIDVLIG